LQESDQLFASALQLEDAGRHEEALRTYAALLAANVSHTDAWHNRGLLLARLGRLHEAEHSHRAFVAAIPTSWRAHSDLADVLLAQARYDEALVEATLAVKQNTPSFLPFFTASLASAMTKRFAEAQHWLDGARRLDRIGFERFLSRSTLPGSLDRNFDPRAIFLIREFDRLEVCDWRRYGALVEEFESIVQMGEQENWSLCAPPLVFRSFHLPLPQKTRRTLADNAAHLFSEATAQTHVAFNAPRSSPKRIRVGYLSSDFRTHPTAILGAPVFRLHDRARFEVHAFSLMPPDGGPWSTVIRRDADHVHELAGMPFMEALSRIRSAQLDILVDWNGLSTGALPELLAARAAPVQVSFLAFPGTSGGGLSDYLICDGVCVPKEESAGYSECLARLPQTFWLCDPAATIEPGHVRSRHQLPDDAVVFLAHHPSRKLAPSMFAEWMAILAAVPASVLWLLEEHPATRQNLLREAVGRGIEPSRLVFAQRVPHAQHRARIALADIALDTSPCNGGTTTLDALASGVPVVTHSTPGFAGRMAASALAACGLQDWIQPDPTTYRSFAVRMATDTKGLSAVRQHLTEARTSSGLFDAGRRVRELEWAYRAMHRRTVNRQPLVSFDVPESLS
jgi:protein O-GlcNAc transferase